MTNRRPYVGVTKRVEAVICDKEVMIIDDCSTDGTRILLKKYKEKVGVEVIFQTENSGNEAALCEDFEIAKGEVIIIQDADLEYNPKDYPILLEPILDKRADVVYGYRFLG